MGHNARDCPATMIVGLVQEVSGAEEHDRQGPAYRRSKAFATSWFNPIKTNDGAGMEYSVDRISTNRK